MSLYAHCQLTPAKQNGNGGEKQIFPWQWPPNTCLSSLNRYVQVFLWLRSSTVGTQSNCMYIYWETKIIHSILWCSRSCDWNKDEYNRHHALWLWNPRSHCSEKTTQYLLQSCAEVSGAPKIQQSNKSNLIASWMHLHNCRCFQVHLRMLLQSLKALCWAPGGNESI